MRRDSSERGVNCQTTIMVMPASVTFKFFNTSTYLFTVSICATWLVWIYYLIELDESIKLEHGNECIGTYVDSQQTRRLERKHRQHVSHELPTANVQLHHVLPTSCDSYHRQPYHAIIRYISIDMGINTDCPIFGYPLLSQERVKLRISNSASTFTESIRTKAH